MTALRCLMLLVGLALCLELAACGKKNDPDPPSGPTAGVGRPYPRQ